MEHLLFKTENDEFHVKVAESLDEACKLLEEDFEYITDMDTRKETVQKEKVGLML
jgi:hypothetical protein